MFSTDNIICPDCKNDDVVFNADSGECICRSCGLVWRKGAPIEDFKSRESFDKSEKTVLTLAGDGVCPSCSKKGVLHHGPFKGKWLTQCVSCDYKKLE